MITDKKYILFDLDGTLTDPKLGICTCVQHALKEFGVEEPNLDKLEPFIGPPLKDSFMQFYGFSEEDAEAAIKIYRERFSTVGKFENEVYDGIPEMLRALKEYGYRLAVASSKPECFVKEILEHFQIAEYFDAVVGSELDGTRVAKSEVIYEALNRLFHYKAFRREQIVMVGDRKFDVEGAKEMDVTSVAVAYGYGSIEELEAAEADYIAKSVAELRALFIDEEELGKRKEDAVKAKEKAEQRAAEQNAPQPNTGQLIWKLFVPFLIFKFGNTFIQQFLASTARTMAETNQDFRNLMLVPDAADATILNFTADGEAIIRLIALLLCSWVVYVFGNGKRNLRTNKEQNAGVKRSVWGWLGWMGAAIVLAAGLNMFFAAAGLLNADSAYQEAAASLYSVSIPLGLLLYGIASPLAEELVFRGIIFQEVKNFWKPIVAAVVSALLFGFYHGNVVQGVYAFCLGIVLACAYQYTGKFIVPVLIHGVVNALVFLASSYGWLSGGIIQLIIGVILTVVGVLAFLKMYKAGFYERA